MSTFSQRKRFDFPVNATPDILRQFPYNYVLMEHIGSLAMPADITSKPFYGSHSNIRLFSGIRKRHAIV
ncbi:MAG: hypothetical protein ACYC43_09345 [Burkholderiales bacterium]